jgi:hypothetical protein
LILSQPEAQAKLVTCKLKMGLDVIVLSGYFLYLQGAIDKEAPSIHQGTFGRMA